MSASPSIERHLQDLELSLLQPGVRKSGRVAELLAEDFVEFGSSGRTFTKACVISSLQSEAEPPEFSASQFRVQLLAPHVALVTYRVHRQGDAPSHSLRSSVWERRQGRWQMLFHQGTPTSAAE